MTEVKGIHLAIGLALVAIAISIGLGVYDKDSPIAKGHVHPADFDPVSKKQVKGLEMALELVSKRLDTERLNNIAMAVIIGELEDADNEMRVAIALLDAKADVTTQATTPTPVKDTIDLDIRVSSIQGQISSSYPRDISGLIINGNSAFFSADYLITIKDPSGAFVKDKFNTTTSKGRIAEGWVPTNALEGTYTVTITIKGLTDSVQFNLT